MLFRSEAGKRKKFQHSVIVDWALPGVALLGHFRKVLILKKLSITFKYLKNSR